MILLAMVYFSNIDIIIYFCESDPVNSWQSTKDDYGMECVVSLLGRSDEATTYTSDHIVA